MADLMALRRRILLDAPQIMTATGTELQFFASLAAPLVSCQSGFLPVQSGSGDPSPTNSRPISAWSDITIYLSGADTSDPTAYTISTGGIYGGYVDLATGELTATWGSVDIGDVTWTLGNNTSTRQSWRTDSIPVKGITNQNDPYHGICSILKTVSQNASWKPYMLCGGQTTQPSRTYLCVPSGAYANSAELQADMSGVLIVYELATPQIYQLSPVTVKTLQGINNLWSNANGALTISYWTH